MASNREKIEKLVAEKKAVSFTEIKSETGLENGTVQYHLNESSSIQKKHKALIETGYCRKCDFNSLCNQKCVLKEIRKPVNSIILRNLSEENLETISSKIEKDLSTTYYYIRRMEDLGILDEGEIIEEVGKKLNEIN